MVSFDPSRPDFAPYGLTCERWTPVPMRRPDRHNEVELNLVTRGELNYLLGGRKVSVPAGRLAVFWAGIPHQVLGATERRREYFVATLPLAWFLQCGLGDRLVRRVLHAQLVIDPAPPPRPADADVMGQWVDDLARRNDPERRRAVLLEMEARLRRLALHLPPYAPPAAGDTRHRRPTTRLRPPVAGDLTKAEQMACFVATHYTHPLRVDDIADAVGLHPNYAMSLFKRAFGATLVDYVAQHRVSHAQRLLATTDRAVLDVALDSGFGSVSRFNAVFRRACGCAPRAYRRAHGVQPADDARRG